MIVLGLLFHGSDNHASVSVIGSPAALRSNDLERLILTACMLIVAYNVSVKRDNKWIMRKDADCYTN